MTPSRPISVKNTFVHYPTLIHRKQNKKNLGSTSNGEVPNCLGEGWASPVPHLFLSMQSLAAQEKLLDGKTIHAVIVRWTSRPN